MEPSAGARSSSQALPKPPETFRASCDNCNKSKVRCGKEHPRCQRCTHQGVTCFYSPSQRARRRRACSTMTQAQPKRPPVPAPSVSLAGATPVSPPLSEADNNNPAIALLSHLNSPNANNWLDKVSTPDDIFDTGFDDLIKLGYPGPPPDLTTNPESSSLSEHLPTPQWLQSNSQEQGRLEEDDITNISTRPDQALGSGLPQQSPRSRSSLASEGVHQHWPGLACSILQSLDTDATSCSSFTPSLNLSSESGSCRSLDRVLRVNQSARDNVLSILNCSCTADTGLALLVAMIVSKILSWYQAVLNRSCKNGDGGMAGNTGSKTSLASPSSSNHHRGSLSPAVGESVFLPPISIGAYQLDADHWGRMIAQLILTELAKMRNVIEVFSKRYGPQESMPTEDSNTQLHFALEVFLRSRLKMTIVAAREQLAQD